VRGSNQQFASPEEALIHFGVKGMKWGVRKERAKNLKPLITKDITRTTKNGDKFTLAAKPPTKLHRVLAAASKNYAKGYREGALLTIKDKQGKKIGDANFWHKDKDTVYLNWISVNQSARGKGYATAVLKAAEDHSRAAGKKKMILEVPGNAPDARHIYEKMGFKVTKEADKKDNVWGGLTTMEKKLPKRR
jgi:ribosomal protein S18 acetylase RimI-like enzyme